MEEGGEISASLKIKLCKCRRTNEGMEIENGNETGNHDENFSINKYKIQEKKCNNPNKQRRHSTNPNPKTFLTYNVISIMRETKFHQHPTPKHL